MLNLLIGVSYPVPLLPGVGQLISKITECDFIDSAAGTNELMPSQLFL